MLTLKKETIPYLIKHEESSTLRNSGMIRRGSKETHSEWPQHFQHENHEAKLSVAMSTRGTQKFDEDEKDLVDPLTSSSQR